MDLSPPNAWPAEPRARLTHRLARRLLALAPFLIIALALALRLYGINWDQERLFHPDERAILFHVNDMELPALSDLGALLDIEESPLNPRWFPYGTLPLYAVKLVQAIASPVVTLDFSDLRYLGRGLSALADVGTVLFVFLLARRLYGRRVGVLASLLAALAVLHIQLSHFYAVDTYLTFFIVASVFFMARVTQEGRLRDSLLAGVFIGLALASKTSVAPLFLALVVAHGMHLFSSPREGGVLSRPFAGLLGTTAKSLALAVVASILVFFITTPYAFLDWYRPEPCQIPFSFLGFLDNNYFACEMGAQLNMVRGASGLPFTQQYIDTVPYWYQVRQLALFGLGLPLGIVAWASLLFTVVVAAGRRRKGDLLLLAWVLPYFLLTGYLQVKFLRYMLPLTPFLIIMASQMLLWARDWVAEHRTERTSVASAGIVVVVLATGWYALAYLSIYNEPHTAVRASQWINENVPRGSVILREHWEEQLSDLGAYRLGCGNTWDEASCMRMYDSDTVRYDGGETDKMTRVAEQLAGGDYLVFYSNRLYGSIPRVPERYPESGEYYRRLFGGDLGYTLEHWEASYPTLLGVALVDDTLARPGLPKPEELGPFRPAPITINLGYADESFSVYDHPLVLVFKNTGRLEVGEILGWLRATPPEPTEGKSLMLSPATLAAQRQGGSWTSIFDPDSLANRFPAVIWLVWVQVLALLALPISLLLFRALPDRGYLLAKPLGILVVAYVAWLLASLQWMPFSRNSVLLAALLMAAVSLALVYTRRVDMYGALRANVRIVLVGEAVFLGAFLLFLLVRAANPDLWHPFNGGEKPMEMAYLTAVVRSTYMPPYDPWFAGGYINYYYFGQFIVASIIKVTGVLPEIAFNLAVPLLFALTAAGVFSLTYNLTEGTRRGRAMAVGRFSPVVAGLAAVFLVALMGNLDGLVQLGQALRRVWEEGMPFGAFDFWRSSRLISPGDGQGHEITEFPFFTFLFADLHPHMMAIPFALLAMGLSLNLVLRIRQGVGVLARLALLVVLALAVGSLRAINTWDFPTYLLLAVGAVFLGEYALSKRLSARLLARVALQGVFLYWAATVLFAPFIDGYQSFSDGVFPSRWQTPLRDYLGVHALFIFVTVTFLAYSVRSHVSGLLRRLTNPDAGAPDGRRGGVVEELTLDSGKALRVALLVGLSIASLIALVVAGYTTTAFIALLLVGMLLLLQRWLHSPRDNVYGPFALALLVMALALGIGVELVSVKGDIDRMNTVFKFYLQAWVLFGVVTAYLLWRLGPAAHRAGRKNSARKGVAVVLIGLAFLASWAYVLLALPPPVWLAYGLLSTLLLWRLRRASWVVSMPGGLPGAAWLVVLAALFLGSSVYTVGGTRDRLRDRFQLLPLTLNGLAFMEEAEYNFDRGMGVEHLTWDYQAIKWLRGPQVSGSPVVLEGQGALYRTLHDRVSIYTGLPTVLGWDNHQSQQRGYTAGIGQRVNDVHQIYSSTDWEQARELLRKYQVEYIYVGEVERHYYPQWGLDKLQDRVGQDLEMAYQNEGVTIYRVVPPPS